MWLAQWMQFHWWMRVIIIHVVEPHPHACNIYVIKFFNYLNLIHAVEFHLYGQVSSIMCLIASLCYTPLVTLTWSCFILCHPCQLHVFNSVNVVNFVHVVKFIQMTFFHLCNSFHFSCQFHFYHSISFIWWYHSIWSISSMWRVSFTWGNLIHVITIFHLIIFIWRVCFVS
jgi:hypothetical protein